MKYYNRVFALILIAISGLTGGIILLVSWRVMALALISLLTLMYGLSVWRGTYENQDLNLGQEKGLLKIQLKPAIMLPIIALAFGSAIASFIFRYF